MAPAKAPPTVASSIRLRYTRARRLQPATRGQFRMASTVDQRPPSRTQPRKCTRRTNSPASRLLHPCLVTLVALSEQIPRSRASVPAPQCRLRNPKMKYPRQQSTRTAPRPSTRTMPTPTTQTRSHSRSTRSSRCRTSAADGGKRRRRAARPVSRPATISSCYKAAEARRFRIAAVCPSHSHLPNVTPE